MQNEIQKLFDSIQTRRAKIAVIGDVLIDEYVRTEKVERMSPESDGVPILRTEAPSYRVPGGAGNCARQLTRWPADVFLLGLVDLPTDVMLRRFGINQAYSVTHGTGHNPVKRRYFVGDNMVLRHDDEQLGYGCGPEELPQLRRKILANLHALLCDHKIDVLVVSDYDKGLLDEWLLQEIFMLCRAAGAKTVVDAKQGPWLYRGANVLRMNEAYCDRYASALYVGEHFDLEVVTHGSGLTSCRTAKDAWNIVAQSSREPAVSVIGAGDCFTAHLALALADLCGIQLASEIADAASRLYVQDNYNTPVYPLDVWYQFADSKQAPLSLLIPWLKDQREAGAKVVFTNGCFDVLHPGHLHTLEWAKSQGNHLIVGVNDDAGVARLKGPGRPMQKLEHRVRMLEALECVDFVVSFSEHLPNELMRALSPDILVKGPDYAGKVLAGEQIVHEKLIAPPSDYTGHSSDLHRAGFPTWLTPKCN